MGFTFVCSFDLFFFNSQLVVGVRVRSLSLSRASQRPQAFLPVSPLLASVKIRSYSAFHASTNTRAPRLRATDATSCAQNAKPTCTSGQLQNAAL